jgi:hypothetical protein
VSNPTYTTGHCAEKTKLGGCQRHNLQCGYPDCDRRVATPTVEAAAPTGDEGLLRQALEDALQRFEQISEIDPLSNAQGAVMFAKQSITTIRTRLASPPPAPAAVPPTVQGWKMVPIEPTEEMLRAFTANFRDHPNGTGWEKHAATKYRAMLAASPPSPPPAQAAEGDKP